MKKTLILCLSVLLVSSVTSTAAVETDWKAGVATANITPDRPMPMSGYAGRKAPATGKDQDLFGKALAIEDQEGNRVVFITLDLIGVVGVNYEIVQNREALSLLRGIAGRGKDLTFNRGGTFNNGSLVWVMLSIDDFLIEPVPGDVIVPYIVISNSHDGTQGVRATFVTHRQAGLGMHHVGKGLSFRHTKNVVDRMERGENVLAAGMDAFERFQDFAMDLAQHPMLAEDWEAFLDDFVPPPDEDNLRPGRRNKARDTLTTLFLSGPGTEIPGVKHTRWAALSAVSTWLTHFASSRGGEGALNSLWFKTNANKLEHAGQLLRKMKHKR